MKILKRPLTWLLLSSIALICIAGTKLGQLTETTAIRENSLFYVVTNAGVSDGGRSIRATNLISSLSGMSTWPSASSLGATNLTTTNATRFGVFSDKSGATLRFFGLEQGTNAILYRNGSNIVINGQPGGSGPANAIANLGGLGTNTTFYGDTKLGTALAQTRAVLSIVSSLTNAVNSVFVDSQDAAGLVTLMDSIPTGWLVELGVGVFNIGSNRIVMPKGVTLKGAGPLLTTIRSTLDLGKGAIVTPSDNSVVSDLLIEAFGRTNYFQSCYGNIGIDPPATNAYLQRVHMIGGTDCIYVAGSTPTNRQHYVCENLKLLSGFDVFSIQTPTDTNSLFEVRNSIIEARFGGITGYSNITGVAVGYGRGTIRLFNCDIISTGHSNNYGCWSIYSEAAPTKGQLELYGVNRFQVRTNGLGITTDWEIQNEGSAHRVFCPGGGQMLNMSRVSAPTTLIDFAPNHTGVALRHWIEQFIFWGLPFDTSKTWGVGSGAPATGGAGSLFGRSDGASGSSLYAHSGALGWLGLADTNWVTRATNQIVDLTEDVTPDTANDFVVTLDASVAALKKVKLSNLGAGGGGGPFNITQFKAENGVTSIISGFMATNANLLNITNRGDMTNAGNLGVNGLTFVNGLTVAGAISAAASAIHQLGGLTVNDVTANRMVTANGSSKLTATDMRLASSLAGAIDGHGLVYNSASGTWTNGAVGGSGEVNTGSSLGNGQKVFDSKSGVDLRFNSLSNLNGTIAMVSNANVISFGATNINTAEITNDAVTYAKMQNVSTTQRALGRNTAGAGDTEEVTLSQILDWVGSAAQGDILYRGAATWARLAAGTSGQFLQTLGAGANPVWAASGGGGLTTNANQFGPQVTLTIKDSAYLTNVNLFGTTLASDIVVTNRLLRQIIHLGNDTNIVIDWSKTNSYIATPSNTFTISMQNSPTAIGTEQSILLYLVNTNATSGFFPTNDLDGLAPTLLASPSTNLYWFNWNGTNRFYISSGQRLTTGTGPTVLQSNAVVWNMNHAGTLQLTNPPGATPVLRFNQTNGTAYSEFTVPSQWLPTNRFVLSVTNPVAGQVLEILNVSFASGVATITLTNGTDDTGGGGGVNTNANQFGAAGATLTIKDGPLFTNVSSEVTLKVNGDAFISTNANASNVRVTNQIYYGMREYSGSPTTVQVDFNGPVRLQHTNQLNTNVTFQITNVTDGSSLVYFIKGNTLGTNFTATVGTNGSGAQGIVVRWLSPTNGVNSFQVDSNQYYEVSFRCEASANAGTNVIASWSTTSPQPIRGSAILIAAGSGTSNAVVGGRIFVSTTSFTNCCASGTTNLTQFTVPANTLTNVNDTLDLQTVGTFSLTGQSKGVLLVYGSETLLDTGSQAVSNGTWRAGATITRTGNTAQYYSAWLQWDRAVIGGQTNRSGLLVQTNGIDTVLKVQGTSGAVASITNEFFALDYKPGPR